MKAVLAFLLFLAIAVAVVSAQTRFNIDRTDTEQMFSEWQEHHLKSYSSPEEAELRYFNFLGAIEYAKDLNRRFNSTSYGVTMFSDMSHAEWKAKYLLDTSKLGPRKKSPYTDFVKKFPNIPVPGVNGGSANPRVGGQYQPNMHYDWIYGTCVTPIYNQAQCGSCWAFSAMEQIETDHSFQHNLAAADLTADGTYPLAVQQIVDCDTTSGGCNGGWTESAYDYVIGAGGIVSQSVYPYTAQNGQCQQPILANVVTLNSWNYVGNGTDASLLYSMGWGPSSVCIAADIFYAYTNGVITAAACGTDVNHCIQVTGWYTDGNGDPSSWNLRNQWGMGWGEGGFVQFEYGDNCCAIMSGPTQVNAN